MNHMKLGLQIEQMQEKATFNEAQNAEQHLSAQWRVLTLRFAMQGTNDLLDF